MENEELSGTATGALVEANSRPFGLQLVNTHLTNKTSDPNDLVEIARQVQMAEDFIRSNAGNALKAIAEQIKELQEKAKHVLEKAKLDSSLHHAACNLVKQPGKMYYLYERPSKQQYLSILSPEDWGPTCPHIYLGGYRLEGDRSWTPLEQIKQHNEQTALVDQILKAQLALPTLS